MDETGNMMPGAEYFLAGIVFFIFIFLLFLQIERYKKQQLLFPESHTTTVLFVETGVTVCWKSNPGVGVKNVASITITEEELWIRMPWYFAAGGSHMVQKIAMKRIENVEIRKGALEITVLPLHFLDAKDALIIRLIEPKGCHKAILTAIGRAHLEDPHIT